MKERIVFLDYVRVMACLMVMLVHASENFYLGTGEMVDVVCNISTEENRLWVSLIDGFCRMSVPLFMITSAYLLAPLREDQSWGEFFRRRALRIVPPLAVFLVLYSALPLLWGGTTVEAAKVDLLTCLVNFPGNAGHLWFVYCLLGIYMFIPIVSPWLRQASPRQERFVIWLFVLSTTMPFFNRWVGDVFGQVWWNQYHMLYYFSGYLGYLVIAHYIRVHLTWDTTKRVLVGLPMMLAGAVATILSFYLQIKLGQDQEPTWVELGWSFCTITCLPLTVGAFLLMTCIKKAGPCYGLIRDISKLSYGMFLMHMFYLVLYANLYMGHMPTALCIPAIAVSTFVSCYLTTKAISYIPGSKWIIG